MMSSKKGAVTRKRPQKHQNRHAFKNDLHDKSNKTKVINSIHVSGVCNRCKEKIDWKIKYKKYKPLTAPKKCVRCEQKTVKKAYHCLCSPCSKSEGVCAKCFKKDEVVEMEENTPLQDAELQNILKSLTERKRRTFIRYIRRSQEKNRKKVAEGNQEDKVEADNEFLEKMEKIKLSCKNLEKITDFDFGSDGEEGSDFSDSSVDCDE